MMRLKVIIKVADYGHAPQERQTIIAEITNNLGRSGILVKMYHAAIDQDVIVELAAIEFWAHKTVPLYTLSEKLTLLSLERLNLYSPETL